MPKQSLRYNQLTPLEADYLHPNHWDGHTVGVGQTQRFDPVRVGFSLTRQLLAATNKAWGAINAYRDPSRRLFPVVYGPGSEFTPADHTNGIIVFDQSTLISRGAAYQLNPGEFPPNPSFAVPPQAPPEEHYVEQPHMRYLRGMSPVVRVGKGEDAYNVRTTSMEPHIGLNEYHWQMGTLSVAETVTVGQLTHLAVPQKEGGHEILTRTHNIYVFPPAK